MNIRNNSSLLSASSRRPKDVKMLRVSFFVQNEDGVESTFGTMNDSFALFYATNYFVFVDELFCFRRRS